MVLIRIFLAGLGIAVIAFPMLTLLKFAETLPAVGIETPELQFVMMFAFLASWVMLGGWVLASAVFGHTV